MPAAMVSDHIYWLGSSARAISQKMPIFCEALNLMAEIVQLVERFGALGEKERVEVAEMLKRYALGDIDLEALHYSLLDEGLIPMPARCTMYHKPKESPEAREALKALINEKISGL